ncbi:MAG TPA: hypothetical protein VMQ73_22670 [Methylomirabilota bacterium]|nr:hypothetical protein [Methylomirabilota bacterium]
MSATFATFARPTLSNRPGALSRLLGTAYDAIAGYFARRAAIASLREADEHTLWDIGLVRSQIEAAVDGSYTPSGPARM